MAVKKSAQKSAPKKPAQKTAPAQTQPTSTQMTPIESTDDKCKNCGSLYYFEVKGVRYCASGCGDAGREPLTSQALKPVAPAVAAPAAPVAPAKPAASSLNLDEALVPGEELVGDSFIVPTGVDSTQKEHFEIAAAQAVDAGFGSTLADIYDREMKLIYVVDNSGSMADGMDKETDEMIKLFDWPPELLMDFRKALHAQDQAAPDPADVDIDDEEFEEEFADTPVALNWLDPASTPDLMLQMKILDEQLNNRFNITLKPKKTYIDTQSSMRKLDVVKTEARGFVEQRFQKFPSAKVAVFSFNNQCVLRAPVGSLKGNVLEAIDAMYPNGTTFIFGAVERVMNECGRRKKEIGMHHIVLVSDGWDHSALQVEGLVPKMKEIGIVFDFIFVANRNPMDRDEQLITSDVAACMKRVCEATGGEYTEVNKASDFKQKFLTASTRLCLPQNAGK